MQREYNVPDHRSNHKALKYQGAEDGFVFQLHGEAGAPLEIV